MKNNLLLFFFLFLLPTPSFSEEVYVNINFQNEGNQLYRIKTNDEAQKSVGLCISMNIPVSGYFIDSVKNHRFIYGASVDKTSSKVLTEPIFRQVYDGDIKEAELGQSGSPCSYDSRDELILGEKGKAVYRSSRAVFSAGCGKRVEPWEAKQNIEDGECEIVEGKNWYSIPNGSWYQTWHKSKGSYDIFYDSWEEVNKVYLEEVWRSPVFYKAFDRAIASVPVKMLTRGKVDAALEKVEDGEPKTVLEVLPKIDFFMLPASYNRENQVGCYYWQGKEKGLIKIESVKSGIEPIFESLEADNRFVCYGTAITGTRKFYILGTDILKEWLQIFGMSTERVDCTKAASVSLDKSLKSMIYIYSEPEMSIYRFIVNEENQIEIGLPKKIKLDFKVASMFIAPEGTLYLIPKIESRVKPTLNSLDDISMETCRIKFKDGYSNPLIDSYPESEEAYEAKVNMAKLITCQADCDLILSRAYYQRFYELPFGSDRVEKLDYEIFLGKEFYSLKLSFKSITMAKLEAGLDILLEEAKKEGNLIGEIEDKVPDYQNTFKKPEKYFLAVSEK